MNKPVRRARVTTEADEVYVLTRFDDNTLHVERTHSSARSPRIADDDFIASGPLGGIWDANDPNDIVTAARMPYLNPGHAIVLRFDTPTGKQEIKSAPITSVEILFTNKPDWNNL